jgi:thioredoxin-like negative regulator of GroEL
LTYTWGTPRQWGPQFFIPTQFSKDFLTKMNAPLITKDSRENLHNTSKATDSMADWRAYWKEVLDETEENFKTENQMSVHKQKIVADFLDTLCGAFEELSGEEIFDCFFEAVQSQFDYTKKEHDKTSELLDLLAGLK